jgi:hypothetical protein
MARALSPAQVANQITWQLKGDLKNIQLAYIRVASRLARIRDEELWKALGHPSLEDYAQKRLGQQRATLYHYLQVHDWLKRDHPAWLAPKPKGFIPSLTGASALMWIEDRLHEGRVSDEARKELESMRRQALRGTLTQAEFRALRASIRGTVEPLRAMLDRMKSLRGDAEREPRFPEAARAALDEAVRALEQVLETNRQVAKLIGPSAILLAERALERGAVVV